MSWWNQFLKHVRIKGEILEFDMEVRSNRTLAKNLARMFLAFVSEVDRKGEQRSGDPIRGETPLRYLATVVKTHEGRRYRYLFRNVCRQAMSYRF